MNDKQKTLQIEIHLIIDRLQNGLIHPMTAKKLLYESANKALIITDVVVPKGTLVCDNCETKLKAQYHTPKGIFCIKCKD